MKTYTFVIGTYTDKRLPKELARALAAAKRAAATEAARKKEKQEVLRRAAGGVICLAADVWLFLSGKAEVMLGFAALLALLGAVLLIRALRPPYFEQKKTANALLKSLNQIESSQKARVQFSNDSMSIHAAGNSAELPLQQIDAAAISPRLCVLLHGNAATVLQKQDLVSQTFAEFVDELRQAVSKPIVEIS